MIKCSNCGQLKEFYIRGLCRKCYKKEWHEKHKESENQKAREWKKRNYDRSRIADMEWKAKNKEKISKYMKEYYIKNQTARIGYSKKYREKHPERVKESEEKWAKKYPEKVIAKIENLKRWVKEHPERIKITQKKWQQSFSGKISTKQARIKRRVNGVIVKKLVERIFNENILKYGTITCEKCKKQCAGSYENHIDHIIPISKGGGNDYDNLQILCADCNRRKRFEIKNYKKPMMGNQMFLHETIIGD